VDDKEAQEAMTWDTSDIIRVTDFEVPVSISESVERRVLELARSGNPDRARKLARKLAPNAMYPNDRHEHYLDRLIAFVSWDNPDSEP